MLKLNYHSAIQHAMKTLCISAGVYAVYGVTVFSLLCLRCKQGSYTVKMQDQET